MTSLAVGLSHLELVQGDITLEQVDAIGNAANSRLAGGGGVDGAIHRAGGPEIMKELKAKYKSCPTGQAVITGGGNLKARSVIHAVGPVYSGKEKDAQLLSGAYRESLQLCVEHGIKRVAFPSLSTGVYGYPLEKAAPVALKTVKEFMESHPGVELVRFVLFDKRTFQAYQKALGDLKP